MDSTTLLKADYLDIIFSGRNKMYGGYELRKHYSQRLRRAVLSLVAAIAAFATLSFIIGSGKEAVKPRIQERPIEWRRFENPPVAIPKVTAPPPAAVPKIKTKIFMPPIITNDPIKPDQPTTDVKSLANTQPGNTNSDGPAGNGPAGSTVGNGPAVQPAPAPPAAPVIWVEQMPQFVGDMAGYLSSQVHYPESARENNIEGKVIVRFVVNEDGSISDATIARSVAPVLDQEALRVIRAMPKWKPGKQNGMPVKVYFTLPIIFELH